MSDVVWMQAMPIMKCFVAHNVFAVGRHAVMVNRLTG